MTRPEVPQQHALFTVLDVPSLTASPRVGAALAALGGAVMVFTDPDRPVSAVTPDGPGDLTVTIGIGPRLVRLAGPSLPGRGLADVRW